MQTKKTIVYISQPTYGGVIEYLYMLLKNINKEKYNHILIISEEYKENIERFRPYISEVYYLPMTREIKFKPVLKSVLGLRKIIKKIRPDIVYMHSSMAGAVGRIALFFNMKIKTLYNAHGWYFNAKISKKKKKIYALIERILALRTNKIINISKAEYESALQYKIAPPKKMCIIENGIDLKKFENCNKYRDRTREKYNIKDNEIVIGVVGRLSEAKDPMTTIKAFNEVYKQNKNVRLMYVGAGELEDEIMKYAKENNLQHLVTITGWVNDTEKYIPTFDIAILPSKWEGFGLALIEYMACDKPIIASDVGGITNIIEDGKNGLLFSAENYEELAKKIKELIDKKNLQQSIVKQNKKYRKKYDIQLLLENHEKLFEILQ